MKIRTPLTLRTLAFTSATLLTLSACTSTRKTSTDLEPRTSESQTQVRQSNQPSLKLCKTKVSNPPKSIDNRIARKSPIACVNGVKLIVVPAPKACLSSGFGKRNKRHHNGIDYQSRPAGNVVASAGGVIVNIEFRKKDYGHWIIIDHGDSVYTSYAHLQNITTNLKIGTDVNEGQVLGKMGKSGNAASAIHLHFEVRQGNYDNPKRWWGLKPINPFSQKEKC